MEEISIKDKRKFTRFLPPLLKAQLLFEEEKKGWEKCIIINISRNGVGIRFSSDKQNKTGALIHLEIFLQTESSPIHVTGILKWAEFIKDGNFFGGIEFNEVLDEAICELLN